MTVDSISAEKGAAILAASQAGHLNSMLWRAARGGGFGAVDAAFGTAGLMTLAAIFVDLHDAAIPLATFTLVLFQWSVIRITKQIKAVCALVEGIQTKQETA